MANVGRIIYPGDRVTFRNPDTGKTREMLWSSQVRVTHDGQLLRTPTGTTVPASWICKIKRLAAVKVVRGGLGSPR